MNDLMKQRLEHRCTYGVAKNSEECLCHPVPTYPLRGRIRCSDMMLMTTSISEVCDCDIC